jgi:drug/metabolite transporter (DMT)-like permease
MVSLRAALDIAPDPFEAGGSGLALVGALAVVAGVVHVVQIFRRPRRAFAYFVVAGPLFLAVGVLLVWPFVFPHRTHHGPPIPPVPPSGYPAQ